jgi:hypothetical protein
MDRRALIVSLFILLGFVATPGSVLAGNFSFECPPDRYVAVPLGQATHEFQTPLSAVPPGDDNVDVTFETHLPDYRSARWCYGGTCYFSDQRIRLVSGMIGRLDIDIFPYPETPGVGWVDISIRSVADPFDVVRCTYTLYSGMQIPSASYTVDRSDNARWLPSGSSYAEFFSPIRDNLSVVDTLLIHMIPSLPWDWGAQFCRLPGGSCFFPVPQTVYHGGVLGDVVAGVKWGLLNDAKDDTTASWVVGADVTLQGTTVTFNNTLNGTVAGTEDLIITGNAVFANYLVIPHVPGVGEVVVFCAALVGAGLGFLWFNTYPAQVFMGDVGALALGAALGVVAVIVRQELVLAIMGGIFVLETVSVMLQVASFRLRGKRIFRMAPIHHHYELKGWAEPKVIVRFWIISFMLVLVGLATLKLR